MANQQDVSKILKLSANVRGIEATVDQTVKELSKDEAVNAVKVLQQHISQIPANSSVEAAALGGANTAVSKGNYRVNARGKTGGYTLFWRGPQVEYLEYGTGIWGSGTYPGDVPAGYEYNEVGHQFGEQWIFEDVINGKSRTVWSYGWAAYAPMYKTYLLLANTTAFRVQSKLSKAIRTTLAKT